MFHQGPVLKKPNRDGKDWRGCYTKSKLQSLGFSRCISSHCYYRYAHERRLPLKGKAQRVHMCRLPGPADWESERSGTSKGSSGQSVIVWERRQQDYSKQREQRESGLYVLKIPLLEVKPQSGREYWTQSQRYNEVFPRANDNNDRKPCCCVVQFSCISMNCTNSAVVLIMIPSWAKTFGQEQEQR